MHNDDFNLDPIPAPLPFDDPPPSDKEPARARCESCGGPAEDGHLCATCSRAFEAVLRATSFDGSSQTEQPFEPAFTRRPAPPATIQATGTDNDLTPVPEPAVVAGDAPAPEEAAASLPAEPSVADSSPAAAPATAPAPVVRPVPAAAASRRGLRSLGTVAAAAIVVATVGIPLSRLWLSRQTIVITQEIKPSANAPAAAPAAAKPLVKNEPMAAAAPAAATPARPPAGAAPVRTPKAERPKPAAAPPSPAIAAPSLAVDVPVAAALPAPEPVAIEAPAPPPPASPIGPFFESQDVDRAPQVASRVDPRIPESLHEQARSEIVIVRVLVSQTGQPAMVNLLRRSKAGTALDAAVIEAVKRWTFTPATKRGQAVSCFLNVGVPVAP